MDMGRHMSQGRDALIMQLLLGMAAIKAGTVCCILSGILLSCSSPYLCQFTTSDALAGRADQLSCLTAANVFCYMACDVCYA